MAAQCWKRMGAGFPLATLHMNTAIHNRLGDDAKALVTYDRKCSGPIRSWAHGELCAFAAEHNRAMSLRNLGRFWNPCRRSQRAHTVQMRLGNKIALAFTVNWA
ncbi:MAG: hypothetical protein R2838_01685 [Caldilineaceae bacterium]